MSDNCTVLFPYGCVGSEEDCKREIEVVGDITTWTSGGGTPYGWAWCGNYSCPYCNGQWSVDVQHYPSEGIIPDSRAAPRPDLTDEILAQAAKDALSTPTSVRAFRWENNSGRMIDVEKCQECNEALAAFAFVYRDGDQGMRYVQCRSCFTTVDAPL